MIKKISVLLLLLFECQYGVSQNIENINKYQYTRVGVNLIGGSLSPDLSPLENLQAGNYGAKPGLALESGKQYYLHKQSLIAAIPVKAGLEWTFSTGINSLNWNDYYMERHANSTADPDYHFILVSTSLGFGPVISVNPVELIIVDLRIQAVGQAQFSTLDYYENEGYAEEKSLSLLPPQEEDDESASSGKLNYIALGIKPVFGVSIRRKGLGLAVAYSTGKMNTKYVTETGEGKSKVPTKALRFMLSFSF